MKKIRLVFLPIHIVLFLSFSKSWSWEEDSPEFIAIEMPDTSIILPNGGDFLLVPTHLLDEKLAYIDSIIELSPSSKKFIQWLHVGKCNPGTEMKRVKKLRSLGANHVRLVCSDGKTRSGKTTLVDSTFDFQSPNGPELEKALHSLAGDHSFMSRYKAISKRKN